MYCKYCGEKIGDDVVFCPKCGKKMADDGDDELEIVKRKKVWWSTEDLMWPTPPKILKVIWFFMVLIVGLNLLYGIAHVFVGTDPLRYFDYEETYTEWGHHDQFSGPYRFWGELAAFRKKMVFIVVLPSAILLLFVISLFPKRETTGLPKDVADIIEPHKYKWRSSFWGRNLVIFVKDGKYGIYDIFSGRVCRKGYEKIECRVPNSSYELTSKCTEEELERFAENPSYHEHELKYKEKIRSYSYYDYVDIEKELLALGIWKLLLPIVALFLFSVWGPGECVYPRVVGMIAVIAFMISSIIVIVSLCDNSRYHNFEDEWDKSFRYVAMIIVFALMLLIPYWIGWID